MPDEVTIQPSNHDWVTIGGVRLCRKHEPHLVEQALAAQTDDQVGELRARVAELETELGEEKAAHAKTCSNFEEYANDEFPLEAVRVGLDVEQEIRARAAELYWNGSPGTWTLQDIVAWIRDGGVPDAG